MLQFGYFMCLPAIKVRIKYIVKIFGENILLEMDDKAVCLKGKILVPLYMQEYTYFLQLQYLKFKKISLQTVITYILN